MRKSSGIEASFKAEENVAEPPDSREARTEGELISY